MEKEKELNYMIAMKGRLTKSSTYSLNQKPLVYAHVFEETVFFKYSNFFLEVDM